MALPGVHCTHALGPDVVYRVRSVGSCKDCSAWHAEERTLQCPLSFGSALAWRVCSHVSFDLLTCTSLNERKKGFAAYLSNVWYILSAVAVCSVLFHCVSDAQGPLHALLPCICSYGSVMMTHFPST